MQTNLGRTEISILTNDSGAFLPQGAVVVVSTLAASSFITTTTPNFIEGRIGVVFDPGGIEDGVAGSIAFSGFVPKINLDGAASIGDMISTSTAAGEGTPHAAPLISGDFAQVLEAGTNPSALLSGSPLIISSGGGGDLRVGPACILPYVYTAKQGTYERLLDYLFYNTSAANGDYLEFDTFLAAGTYNIILVYNQGGNGALLDILLDGTVVASGVDSFGAGVDLQHIVTGAVVASSGFGKKIKVLINGKNPSSSGYYMFWSSLYIYQTS